MEEKAKSVFIWLDETINIQNVFSTMYYFVMALDDYTVAFPSIRRIMDVEQNLNKTRNIVPRGLELFF